MKKLQYLMIFGLILGMGVASAWADTNEEIMFTNFTDEDIDVELAVSDHSGWNQYDLSVLELNTSIANFWVDTPFATFSACAYGTFTGDFYGCVEGDLSHGPFFIYFDFTGLPYLSIEPDLTHADVFLFEKPHAASDVVVIEGEVHDHHGGGCFISAL